MCEHVFKTRLDGATTQHSIVQLFCAMFVWLEVSDFMSKRLTEEKQIYLVIVLNNASRFLEHSWMLVSNYGASYSS